MLLRANIEGLAELDKALADLEVKTATKALRGAMMYATTPLLKDIKAGVPSDSGELRSSIRRKSVVDKKGKNKKNTAKLSIGAMSGGVKGEGWYKANFVENGYRAVGRMKKRKQKATGFKGRWIAPRPFIRPAFDRNKNIIIDRFAERLKQNITTAGGL